MRPLASYLIRTRYSMHDYIVSNRCTPIPLHPMHPMQPAARCCVVLVVLQSGEHGSGPAAPGAVGAGPAAAGSPTRQQHTGGVQCHRPPGLQQIGRQHTARSNAPLDEMHCAQCATTGRQHTTPAMRCALKCAVHCGRQGIEHFKMAPWPYYASAVARLVQHMLLNSCTVKVLVAPCKPTQPAILNTAAPCVAAHTAAMVAPSCHRSQIWLQSQAASKGQA